MRKIKRTGLKVFTLLVMVGFSLDLCAQVDMTAVYDAFNQGVQMIKVNPDAAITSFEKTIQLANQVEGDEAADVKDQAMKQIPKLYWESAKTLAGKKDYDAAIAKLDACIEASNKVDDASQASRASSTILSIINVQGTNALNAGDNEAAITYFDNALERSPEYAKAYLGKVLAYDNMGNIVKMEESALLGLEAAKASRDSKTAGDLQKKLRTTFFNAAQENMKNQDYTSAAANLLKTIQYGDSNSLTYFQLGLAYKGSQEWKNAVDAFNKSVELDMGSDEDKARTYFEMGGAYQELADTGKACESYKKSLFGDFAEAAKYQIENVLKCSN